MFDASSLRPWLRSSTAEERQPYLNKIGALLEDEDVKVRSAACEVFGKCSAEEHNPYLGAIAQMLSDKDDALKGTASDVFSKQGKCSVEERQPHLGTIAQLFHTAESGSPSSSPYPHPECGRFSWMDSRQLGHTQKFGRYTPLYPPPAPLGLGLHFALHLRYACSQA